jgi:hypothetical protein
MQGREGEGGGGGKRARGRVRLGRRITTNPLQLGKDGGYKYRRMGLLGERPISVRGNLGPIVCLFLATRGLCPRLMGATIDLVHTTKRRGDRTGTGTCSA